MCVFKGKSVGERHLQSCPPTSIHHVRVKVAVRGLELKMVDIYEKNEQTNKQKNTMHDNIMSPKAERSQGKG